jgi:hypothetical protein
LLGIYVVLGLVFAAACVHRALNTGRPAGPWLFAGLFLNVVAYLVLLSRTSGAARHAGVVKIPATPQPLACPHCGELNHPSANRCSSCARALEPATVSEASQLSASS